MPTPSAAQAQRLAQANALIQLIAAHGRRFFHNPTHDRVAQFEFTDSGRLVFREEYQDQVLTVPKDDEGPWKGFTHGSTLRTLVIEMGAYIRSGASIHPQRIAPSLDPAHPEQNLWGYDAASASALRQQAHALPMFAPASPARARTRRP